MNNSSTSYKTRESAETALAIKLQRSRQRHAEKNFRYQRKVAAQVRRAGEVLKRDAATGKPSVQILKQGSGATVVLDVTERRSLLLLLKYFRYRLELPDFRRPVRRILLWQEYNQEAAAAIDLASLRVVFGVAPKGRGSCAASTPAAKPRGKPPEPVNAN
ncbi:MAG: hypothetical protein PSV13_19820 [Lacunisphaera sp.]|nr:hypothetical protein [Lacunisphaera sp.]